MHEATLVRQIYKITEQALSGIKVKKVAAVEVSVGEMSGALPDALRFAFNAQRDGIFSEAELIIKKEKVTVRCMKCSCEYHPEGFPIKCPACGSETYTFTGGDDVHVSNVKFEKEGQQ
jgi:hydrogenase nickel incorporation protein HypA/HybF